MLSEEIKWILKYLKKNYLYITISWSKYCWVWKRPQAKQKLASQTQKGSGKSWNQRKSIDINDLCCTTWRCGETITVPWHLGSIFSTFYVQLLCTQIPTEQKRLTTWLYFLHFWDLGASKLLIKRRWNWHMGSISSTLFEQLLW